jgi:hypothetical protein
MVFAVIGPLPPSLLCASPSARETLPRQAQRIRHKLRVPHLHSPARSLPLSLSISPSPPSADYVGTDFFTFRLQTGSLSSAAATVAITVGDEEEGVRSSPGAKPNGGAQAAAKSKPRKPLASTETKEAVEMASRPAKPSRDKGDLL